jgi:hypothetical protein
MRLVISSRNILSVPLRPPAPSAARLVQIMVPTWADRAALSSASQVSKPVDAPVLLLVSSGLGLPARRKAFAGESCRGRRLASASPRNHWAKVISGIAAAPEPFCERHRLERLAVFRNEEGQMLRWSNVERRCQGMGHRDRERFASLLLPHREHATANMLGPGRITSARR